MNPAPTRTSVPRTATAARDPASRTTLSRRSFLQRSAWLPALPFLARQPSTLAANPTPSASGAIDVKDRIRGLLLGGFIGDALGGPIEFQPRDRVATLADPPKVWRPDETLDPAARRATIKRLRLRSYADLRPQPEAYAHWTPNAPAGTVTDDSRHKLVLLLALRRAERTRQWPLTARALAQAYLDWPRSHAVRSRPHYQAICEDWIEEWRRGARWVLGRRDTPLALPPERMWAGLPTCCGQMTMPPLAALFAGRPADAYQASYQLGFFDNGFGRDLNSSLVAGLAAALQSPPPADRGAADWQSVLQAMRTTDPYAYGKVPWVTRPVDRWLDLALNAAHAANQRPALLFAALEREFKDTIKWEAQVPFVVLFACLALAEFDPLCALQLSMEWGHDTDSYAQLMGAFIGARHGSAIFPQAIRTTVAERLRLDYDEDVEQAVDLLDHLRLRATTRSRVAAG